MQIRTYVHGHDDPPTLVVSRSYFRTSSRRTSLQTTCQKVSTPCLRLCPVNLHKAQSAQSELSSRGSGRGAGAGSTSPNKANFWWLGSTVVPTVYLPYFLCPPLSGYLWVCSLRDACVTNKQIHSTQDCCSAPFVCAIISSPHVTFGIPFSNSHRYVKVIRPFLRLLSLGAAKVAELPCPYSSPWHV